MTMPSASSDGWQSVHTNSHNQILASYSSSSSSPPDVDHQLAFQRSRSPAVIFGSSFISHNIILCVSQPPIKTALFQQTNDMKSDTKRETVAGRRRSEMEENSSSVGCVCGATRGKLLNLT